MTVNLYSFPAVSFPECFDVAGHDVLAHSRKLNVVPVDECNKSGEAFLDCGAACFCELSLSLAAVAHQNVNMSVVPDCSLCEREPCTCGESLTEIAGSPVDAGNFTLNVSLKR